MPDEIPEELERELMRRSRVMMDEVILPGYQAVWADQRSAEDVRKAVADLLSDGLVVRIKVEAPPSPSS